MLLDGVVAAQPLSNAQVLWERVGGDVNRPVSRAKLKKDKMERRNYIPERARSDWLPVSAPEKSPGSFGDAQKSFVGITLFTQAERFRGLNKYT